MKKQKKIARVSQFPLEPLESRQLCSATVHDGGGTQLLTSAMLQSGTSGSSNVYQNYLVRSQLVINNLHDVQISGCDVTGISGSNGIFLTGTVTDINVSGNNIHDMHSSNGIGAYNPTTIIDCQFTSNTFTNVIEPIHFDFGQSGQSANVLIQGNYINGYDRIGIELQDSVNGLKVLDNYITNRTNPGSNSGMMAISCATGCPMSQGASSNHGVDTHNVEIAGNVLIGPAWYGGYDFAIEDYGSGSNVHDNYIQHWHVGIGYCWTGVSGQVPWSFSNNTLVDVPGGLTANEGYGQQAGFPEVNPTTNGNAVFAAGAGPAIPSVAATIGGTASTTPTQPAAPAATFTASPAADGIQLSSLPATGGTLTWTATGNTGSPLTNPASGEMNSIAIPAGTTSYVDTSVPNSWQVYYTFSSSPGGVLATAVASQTSAPSTTTTPTPTVTATPTPTVTATPTPTVTATLTATAATNGIHLTLPAGGGTLTWTATGNTGSPLTNPTSGETNSITIPAGTTSFVDTSVPNNWQVSYTYSGAPGQTALVTTVLTQAFSSGSTATPVVSATPGTDGSSVSSPVSTPVVSTSPITPAATGGWTDGDLGPTVSAGSSSVSGGVFTVNSPVADTTEAPVASHFVYQTLGQNGSIVVNVSAVVGTAGLKLASGLQSGDPTASLLTDASGNITFTTQGSTSASSASGSVAAKGDTWLKLVRSGGRITAFASSNGTTWQRIGSAYLNLPSSVDAGMAVTSQTNGASGSARFSNAAVGGASKGASSTPTVSADVAATPVVGAGNGLKAQMYSNITRTGKAMTETDSAVNFNWGQATPNSSISSTPYSVRWTGEVEAEYSDVYTLSVNSDSGAKLFVNGSPAIQNWQGTTSGVQTASVAMIAGKKYHVRLVYGEKGNSDSNVSLGWSSTHQASEIIPQTQLFSDAA